MLTSKLFTNFATPPLQGGAGVGNLLSAHRAAGLGYLEPEPLIPLTLAWLLLLPVAVFLLSLIEISVAHFANYAGVFWPSSAFPSRFSMTLPPVPCNVSSYSSVGRFRPAMLMVRMLPLAVSAYESRPARL